MGSLKEGAKNAVETCVGVKPDEHVLIVTDDSSCEIGGAIYEAAKRITPYTEIYNLNAYGETPVSRLPNKIAKAIRYADVGFYVASSLHAYELEDKLIDLMMEGGKRRHAHMTGITREIMEQGMRVDYRKVDEFSDFLLKTLGKEKKMEIKGPYTKGKRTDLKIELNPEWNWVKASGIIKTGNWDNLPGGEVFTTPYNVDGTIVTNLLGEHFDLKYGILNPSIYFEMKDSRIQLDTLDCKIGDLKEELSLHLKKHKNSDRVGEIGLPTNYELISKPIIGNLLQDEKGRVHIALGDPLEEETGADWECTETHVDCILEKCNVSVDGKPLMELGRYLFDFV